MHRPDLGIVIQRLGERLRYHGSLPGAAREIAILVVGAKWMAEYEWWAHARIGRREGVSDETIDAIHRGERPRLSDPVERAAYDFTAALLETGGVDPALYDAAHAHLGDGGLVELVTLAGYYTLVSFTLNAFDVPLPDGEAHARWRAMRRSAGRRGFLEEGLKSQHGTASRCVSGNCCARCVRLIPMSERVYTGRHEPCMPITTTAVAP